MYEDGKREALETPAQFQQLPEVGFFSAIHFISVKKCWPIIVSIWGLGKDHHEIETGAGFMS